MGNSLVALSVWLFAAAFTGSAHAAQVDALWYDGPPTYQPDLLIKISGTNTATDLTVNDTDVDLSPYSDWWDTAAVEIGSLKQLDLFYTLSNEGLKAFAVSVRYDVNGSNVLTALAARSYNVNKGTRSSTAFC